MEVSATARPLWGTPKPLARANTCSQAAEVKTLDGLTPCLDSKLPFFTIICRYAL
jgi:hypothetical protein